MTPSDSIQDLGDLVLKALKGMDLEPQLIPQGMINELRGGTLCFNLRSRKEIDAAILVSKGRASDSPYTIGVVHYLVKEPVGGSSYDATTFDKSSNLFKIDYAIRGTIRGVLPGRILSATTLQIKGLLRKKLVGIKWETPSKDQSYDPNYVAIRAEGQPPEPGELWEGSPLSSLTERLNLDTNLMEILKKIVEEQVGKPLSLYIISDKWGQSIRTCGNLWLRTPEFLHLYASSTYVGIIDQINAHLNELRKAVGGLTF